MDTSYIPKLPFSLFYGRCLCYEQVQPYCQHERTKVSQNLSRPRAPIIATPNIRVVRVRSWISNLLSPVVCCYTFSSQVVSYVFFEVMAVPIYSVVIVMKVCVYYVWKWSRENVQNRIRLLKR